MKQTRRNFLTGISTVAALGLGTKQVIGQPNTHRRTLKNQSGEAGQQTTSTSQTAQQTSTTPGNPTTTSPAGEQSNTTAATQATESDPVTTSQIAGNEPPATATQDKTASTQTTSTSGQPGFGVLTALGGLVSIGSYLFIQRVDNDE